MNGSSDDRKSHTLMAVPCLGCRRPLPVGSSPVRRTCSAMCRQRLSRRGRRERAAAVRASKYPGLAGRDLFNAIQRDARARWDAKVRAARQMALEIK